MGVVEVKKSNHPITISSVFSRILIKKIIIFGQAGARAIFFYPHLHNGRTNVSELIHRHNTSAIKTSKHLHIRRLQPFVMLFLLCRLNACMSHTALYIAFLSVVNGITSCHCYFQPFSFGTIFRNMHRVWMPAYLLPGNHMRVNLENPYCFEKRHISTKYQPTTNETLEVDLVSGGFL